MFCKSGIQRNVILILMLFGFISQIAYSSYHNVSVLNDLDVGNSNLISEELVGEQIPKTKQEIQKLYADIEQQNEWSSNVLSAEDIKIPFSGFQKNEGQNSYSDYQYYLTIKDSFIGFGSSKIYFSQLTDDIVFVNFHLTFPSANNVKPQSQGKLPHLTNYFIGDFEFVNIDNFEEIWYYNLYEKIDLRYYVTSKGLKYEFIVRPGGNPEDITTQVSENLHIRIQEDKVVFNDINSNKEIYMDSSLLVFQEDNNIVSSSFIEKSKYPEAYGFNVEDYDKNRILIIDPLWLGFSTYLGGSGSDVGNSIDIDNEGNIYVTGLTNSISNFPIIDPYDTYNSLDDVFLIKINGSNNELIYSTYLGGSGSETGQDLVIDSAGQVYITGETTSSNFPTKNAYQSTYSSCCAASDAFITKFNSTGNGLIFSTYLGGDGSDVGKGIAVDNSGYTYISGSTNSNTFPNNTLTFNTTTLSVSNRDIFITKLNPLGSLNYSTYLGGLTEDSSNDIAIDNSGNAYVTGYALSNNFPTVNAYQVGKVSGRDVIVTKLNGTGNKIVYSTFIGGNSVDFGIGIALDSSENIYITGYTGSSDYPTLNPFQTNADTDDVPYSGSATYDSFVTKLNSIGDALVFSTYLGGDGLDIPNDITIDDFGNSYIVGYTESNDFPTLDSYQNRHQGGVTDAYITKLSPGGNTLNYSSYLGGTGGDRGVGIATDNAGNVYITGYSASIDFPVVNHYQNNTDTDDNIFNDIFVSKFLIEYKVPEVDSPNDITYGEYTTGNIINWTIGDKYPGLFNVTKNDTLYSSTMPWTNGSILINIDGLSVGVYNFTIHIYDKARNLRSDSVIVDVLLASNVQPDLNSPKDLNYTEFSTGYTINWTAGHRFPNVYNVTFNSTIHVSTTPWSNGSIIVDIDGFPKGNYNFTITVYDILGNSRSDSVILRVFDITVPDLDSPPDSNHSEFSQNNKITWNAGDRYPDVYNMFLDGIKIYSNITWVNGSIVFDIDGLRKATHNYTIAIYDDSGNYKIDTVIIDVTDDTSPNIDSPADVFYSFGTTDNYILWEAYDMYPSSYYVTIDNQIYNNSVSWQNGTLELNIDGLEVGSYNFTIYVFDASNNSIVDRVTVIVVDPAISLLNPAEGSILNSGIAIQIHFNQTIIEEVQFNWDTMENQILDQPYIAHLPIGDGQHTLNIFARDVNGNWFSESFIFVTDDTPPNVSIANTNPNNIFRSGTEIELNLTDASIITQILFSWDGNANQSLATFGVVLLPGVDGTHNLTIYAEDGVGNWAVIVFGFITDDTDPIFSYSGIANNDIVSGNITILVEPYDMHGIQRVDFLIDDIIISSINSSSNGKFGLQLNTKSLLDGTHTLQINVIDVAGNEKLENLAFSVKNEDGSSDFVIPEMGIYAVIGLGILGLAGGIFRFIRSRRFDKALIELEDSYISAEDVKEGKE